MLFRPKAAPLVDEWVKILDADPKMWDQSAFNDLFLRGAQTTDRKDRLFKGYNGSLLIGILPVSLFCSGHTFFTQQMPLQMAAKPYVAHATFQFSGTPGKRNRFREHLLWSDPPAYYHHSQGFISVENNIPTSLLNRIDDARTDGSLAATEPHFALVNRQLATLRAEFGLATALSRAAVLPELWCGQDRWWAPHHGITPGSQLHLPYKCPADHVLDLES